MNTSMISLSNTLRINLGLNLFCYHFLIQNLWLIKYYDFVKIKTTLDDHDTSISFILRKISVHDFRNVHFTLAQTLKRRVIVWPLPLHPHSYLLCCNRFSSTTQVLYDKRNGNIYKLKSVISKKIYTNQNNLQPITTSHRVRTETVNHYRQVSLKTDEKRVRWMSSVNVHRERSLQLLKYQWMRKVFNLQDH